MTSFTTESIIISRTLERIGYGKDMITVRTNAYKHLYDSLNRRTQYVTRILSGSKAEGMSAVMENDTDIMHIPMGVVCSEYPMHFGSGEEKSVFHILKRHIAPGYAILKLSNICETLPVTDIIKDCLVELLPGQQYISSDEWKQSFKQYGLDISLQPGNSGLGSTSYENHGPSTATSILLMECDNVFAMVCHCPGYLNSWKSRAREYSWPTTDMIEEVSKLESHVVPVGYIKSPLQFLEWRICYTQGEIKLLKCLPDCLIKTYILMKAITKVTLKPLCKEMSSYIIKNIVLWIAELNPSERFSEKNLVTILQYGFEFLKQCLVKNNLPSYMIFERNLFADRLTLQQRSRLCMRIDFLVSEGPRMVLRLKKVREALNVLYYTPEEFRLFSDRRQTVETVLLLLNVYIANNCLSNDGNMDMERFWRNVWTDDLVFRAVSNMLRLVSEKAGTDTERTRDETQRIDPDKFVSIVRKCGPDLARNNPLFQYLR